jgi:rubrerythrin
MQNIKKICIILLFCIKEDYKLENIKGIDVIAIAIDIEHEGYLYYKAAGQKIKDPGLADIFNRLMQDEKGHEKIFSDLLIDLNAREGGKGKSVLDLELESYYESIFYKKALNIDAKASDMKSALDILEAAINNEKDTILFYTELKNALADDEALEIITRIIAEERGHVISLAGEYSKRQRDVLS